MKDTVQYTLKVNDKILSLNDAGEPLVFDDKESARNYVTSFTGDKVQMMHRRLIIGDWYTTTP